MTDSSTTSAYTYAPLDLSETGLNEICALVNRASGNNHLVPEYLRWQYLQNPGGSAVGFNAYLDGKLVSHYVTVPVAARVHGAPARGLLSINTATDPAHMGKGLFTRLASMTYEAGQAQGFSYVVGVANDNSVYGFTRKLGFDAVGCLQTRFVCGHLVYRTAPSPTSFSAQWNRDALRWRLANPKSSYCAKGSHIGAIVYGSSNRFQVMMHESQQTDVLEFTPPPPVRVRLNPFKMWLGLDAEVDWDRTLSVQAPARLKATSLTLIFRDLQKLGAIDKTSVKFWAIDFDSY